MQDTITNTNPEIISEASEQKTAYGPEAPTLIEELLEEQSTPAEQEPSDSPAPEAESTAPTEKSEHMLLRGIFFALFLAVAAVFSLFTLSSEGKIIDETAGSLSFSGDLKSAIRGMESSSLSTVYNLPKVYILPWNENPAPVPSKENYSTSVDESGVEITTYEDETITVNYWQERRMSSNCHFAEVWIAHPAPLRHLLAGSRSGSNRAPPQKLAQRANAVVAINADYCGYREGGIVIRQGTTYRNNPMGWDVLLIDSEGDFHIMSDWKVAKSGVLEDYDIVNTLEFGPSLIVDGEINLINLESGCKSWNHKDSPRTGIGQIGRLHYLLCCVEGRTDDSNGIHTDELADLMYEKGCVQAYNLDGGMSTTMVLDGEAMNTPMWGGQRVVTDIIYFATGLPSEE